MRINEVKVGDTVVPRRYEQHSLLPWTGDAADFLGKPASVFDIDRSDGTLRLVVHRVGFRWWPVEFCDIGSTEIPKVEPAQQLVNHLHEREKAKLQQELLTAQRAADASFRREKELEREKMLLCNQINVLEKQVADLKAERDRVGKTSQSGTRFAQLELD